ncbi:MAG: P-II family nitrogen regulator [Coriobacteriia bacterium]|jgi:nitrogen regulatory protein PII|nr:P-II family nitrogen regulator [Coriobacteriia bacterium]
MAGFSLICCVVKIGQASKTLRAAKRYGVKGGTISLGRGTVNDRFLGLLGLDESRKEIITMIVESELASEALQGIGRDMDFHKPNHGIVFSLPVTEFIGRKNAIREAAPGSPQDNEVKETMFKIIYVVVEKGKAEDVIEVANEAGARGGTIVNARGSGIHEVQKLFSIEIEPEKEEVFIITKEELKDSIVQAIISHLKIDEPGNGILFVMDVNEAYGLH